ncbi:hypothetical protein DXZ75_27950 [Streptomyces sp. AcE210]|nr:hypothetical protein DXZ75_27950 [Streptomyces sp. AcE210]
MLLRLACLTVTNACATLRLLLTSDRAKDAETLSYSTRAHGVAVVGALGRRSPGPGRRTGRATDTRQSPGPLPPQVESAPNFPDTAASYGYIAVAPHRSHPPRLHPRPHGKGRQP